MPRAATPTIDHDVIRRWAEKYGGHPAAIAGTGRGDDPGILRIDFGGSAREDLEPISWEVFFDWFDRDRLALLFREGDRFNKLVSREPQKGEQRRPVNAIALLERQHREVEHLFEELESSEEDGEKLACFEKLADNLAAHAEVEERLFYPTMYADKTKEELREAVEEHLLMKRVIADLLDLKPKDEQFDAKIGVLKEVVEHHVEEEEQQLFPMLRSVDPEALNSLGEMMQTSFEELIDKQPRLKVKQQTSAAASLPPS